MFKFLGKNILKCFLELINQVKYLYIYKMTEGKTRDNRK